MARIDDISNRSTVLATAYGIHAVEGNLILHETNPITGGETQVTILQALGEGEWDGFVQCYYAGGALALSDYHFHPGSLSTGKSDPLQGVDSFFPGGITYNGIAYIAARLPAGVATDANPTDFKSISRCLKVQNYDATGAPIKADGTPGIELTYSPNPARVVADLIILRRGLRRRRKFVGSINTSSNTFTTSAPHGLKQNWVVQVKAYGAGTLPAPLAADTDYFVEYVSDTQYRLYTGPVGYGGAVVDLTTTGAGSFQVIDYASRIDWASWAALRDYCDEVLSWTPGTGLKGEFFSDITLTNKVGTRVDSQINFNFDGESPGFGIDENWTARWTGKVTAEHTETYTFYARYDDSARLWVNGVQLVNDWGGGAARESSGTIALTAGTSYDITLEYRQYIGPGEISLSWSSPSTAKQLIPASALTAGDVALKRFESHVAFTSPTTLQAALEQIMFTCASDWQERGGQVGFILPLPALAEGVTGTFNAGRRRIVHHFSTDAAVDNVVKGSLKGYVLDRRDRWNRVKGHYRNIDDQYLTEDWVYDEREALRDQVRRTVDPGQIELGNMTKSQADRILKWHMRNKSDLTIFCELRGMGDSFHVLPGDVVKVSSALYGWVEALFLVIDATDESAETGADERVFVLQEYQQTYFDTDHGPLQPSIVGTPPTGLEPPPAPTSLTLTEEARTGKDGSVISSIRGTVTFAPYAGRQRGRVWLKKPTDSDFVRTDRTVYPDPATGVAAFELTGLSTGNHRVKVVTESTFGVQGSELVGTPDPINLVGNVATPTAPTGLDYVLGDNGQLKFFCNASPDSDFSHMAVYDGAGNPVQGFSRLDATQWEEQPSKVGLSRKVKFFNRSGTASVFSNTATYTPPVLPALASLTINRVGQDVTAVWVPGDNSSLPSYFTNSDRKFLVEILNGSGVAVRAVTVTVPKGEALRWTVRTDIGNPSLATLGSEGTISTTGASLDNAWAESQEFTARNIAFVYEVDGRCPPWRFELVPSAAPLTCTVDPATDTFTAAGHKLADGDPFELSTTGTAPGGLTMGIIYYATQVSGSTFKAAQLRGGSPVNVTSAGTGTLTMTQEGTGILLETHITGGAPYVWGELAGFTSSSFTRRAVPGDRFAIVLQDGQAAYYEKWPAGTPFYRSSWWPAPGAYKVRVALGFLGGEAQAAVRCKAEALGVNSFLYTSGMQLQDFGSAQNPLTVRVREVSDIAGNGPASTFTG